MQDVVQKHHPEVNNGSLPAELNKANASATQSKMVEHLIEFVKDLRPPKAVEGRSDTKGKSKAASAALLSLGDVRRSRDRTTLISVYLPVSCIDSQIAHFYCVEDGSLACSEVAEVNCSYLTNSTGSISWVLVEREASLLNDINPELGFTRSLFLSPHPRQGNPIYSQGSLLTALDDMGPDRDLVFTTLPVGSVEVIKKEDQQPLATSTTYWRLATSSIRLANILHKVQDVFIELAEAAGVVMVKAEHDVAAGWLLVEEAGGIVASANPGDWHPTMEGRTYFPVRGAKREEQKAVVEELWEVMGGRRFVYADTKAPKDGGISAAATD
ncbi:Inositol-phosphate phosphatase [Ascochyta rabiei]|uniref:Inositol-phosphate phosphatase n=1 Tax=Didymella rabiei TaxID=5454 RepID=UPI002205AE37|nr:Inositol-phosphate phosphatase [Ascochyta rabiei]UPX09957.1 Inositol-phosphate phosphatase [Ascochyta rabiei]